MMIDIGTSKFCLFRFYTFSRLYSIQCTVYTIFKLTSCDPLAAFCAPLSPCSSSLVLVRTGGEAQVPFTRETEGESGDTALEGAWLCIVMRISEGTLLLLCPKQDL
jgi:hypothetical protein